MSADDDMPSAAQVQAAESGRATHPQEPHSGGTAGRLNWLRAAVLVIPLPTRPHWIRGRQRLGGLINEYQPAG